jgi:hypothetical protein
MKSELRRMLFVAISSEKRKLSEIAWPVMPRHILSPETDPGYSDWPNVSAIEII